MRLNRSPAFKGGDSGWRPFQLGFFFLSSLEMFFGLIFGGAA